MHKPTYIYIYMYICTFVEIETRLLVAVVCKGASVFN